MIAELRLRGNSICVVWVHQNQSILCLQDSQVQCNYYMKLALALVVPSSYQYRSQLISDERLNFQLFSVLIWNPFSDFWCIIVLKSSSLIQILKIIFGQRICQFIIQYQKHTEVRRLNQNIRLVRTLSPSLNKFHALTKIILFTGTGRVSDGDLNWRPFSRLRLWVP